MSRIRLLAIFLAAVCSAAHRAPAADAPDGLLKDAAAATFKAGFAERDITPDLGSEQPGNYGKNFNRIHHDPCKVRAAVFGDGKARVAIVGIDAIGIRGDTTAAARKAIEARCGIPAGSVLVAASHSHTAGPTVGALPGEWDGSSDLIKSLLYEKSINADPKYLERVVQAIADSVVEADGKSVASRAAAGFGKAEGVAFNRRFRMKNGLAETHPGQGNPNIVEPAGPVDPQVGVLGAWDADGKLLGCVVNFACHATTNTGGTSADYVAYIEKTIRGLMGEHTIVVFLPGASGDVTQVDNRSPFAVPQFGERSARLLGGHIGAEALKTLLAIQTSAGSLAPIGVQSQVLKIKRRPPKPEKVAAALELVQKTPGKDGVDPTQWTFAKETVLLAEILKKEPVAEVELQAVQVGPAVFLAFPVEYFCQFGLDLKKQSKFAFTFPVSNANDSLGYVPTEEAFGPHGGGYETRLSSYSNMEITAGTRMAEAMAKLSGKLAPGPTPQPPPLPPPVPGKSGPTWTYGNQPPELE